MTMPRGRPPKSPKIAPNVAVVDHSTTDERLMLVNQFAPDCVGNNSEFSAYFDDPSIPAEYYERRGYVPVTTQGGAQVNHKGDRLWKRPRSVVQAEHDDAAERGMDLAASANEPGNEKYADGRLVELDD